MDISNDIQIGYYCERLSSTGLIDVIQVAHTLKRYKDDVGHTATVTNTAKFLIYGDNNVGRDNYQSNHIPIPGFGTDIKVLQISCEVCHTTFITDDGSLYNCGHNYCHQLTASLVTPSYSPIRIPGFGGEYKEKVVQVSCGDYDTAILTNLGKVYHYQEGGICNIVSIKDVKIIYISCGASHTAIIDDMGKIYTYGDNTWGKLGLGDNKYTYRPLPTRIPNFGNPGRKSAPSICWKTIYRHGY